ncbi:MAG: GxxExxY protein [Armatimonadetes bacterium]|nr:GxxExxY protein [Armatimonadota bacterium]
MKHETLTERIIGCIVKVHRTLGPGFVEAIYRRALVIELRRCGVHPSTRRPVSRVRPAPRAPDRGGVGGEPWL